MYGLQKICTKTNIFNPFLSAFFELPSYYSASDIFLKQQKMNYYSMFILGIFWLKSITVSYKGHLSTNNIAVVFSTFEIRVGGADVKNYEQFSA